MYGSDFPFEKNPGITETEYMKPALMANLTDDDYDRLFYKNALDIIKESKREKKGEKENGEMEH